MGMKYGKMYVQSKKGLMEGMKLTKMFCAFMSRFATATVMCGVVLSQCLSAATLPFDVTVLQGDSTTSLPSSQRGNGPREVMFLVIDHSGSMNDPDGRANSRWDALLDSLRSTLKSVRVGTEVRVEWIESRVEKRWRRYVRLPNRPAIGPIILTDENAWKSIWSQVEEIGAPPREYGTPLFETLENVSRAASDLVQRGTRVAVVVFSDGDSNEFRYESEKRKRREQLNKDFAKLFADSRFKTCLVWINPKEAPPEKLMGAKWNLGYQAPPAVYSSTAEPDSVAVENPLSGGHKPGALSFAFFVPPDVWKKMEGKPAQLSVMRRGEKGDEVPVESTTLSIRRGVQTCRIEVPDGLLVAPVRTALSLKLSKIPSPEGALVSPPQSVSLLIAEPKKLTVSPIVPSQGAVFRKGEKIKFSVSATPDASCSWSFDDGTPPEGGLDVYHSYAQAGSYEVKVVVRKDGFAPREGLVETRKIEVVHADVILEPIAKQVQGRESKFSCKGTGPVSGYVWIVDGEEEVSGIDSADKKSSILSYSFQSAGPHTIQVRANMNRIGSVLSEKKSFDVGVAPYLRIDKPDAGTAFVAGEQIPFHAKVDGGVSNVRWSVADSSGTEVWSVPDVADGGESKSVATLDKPGEYTARVVDAAGLAVKAEVVFSVRPKDVSLVVSEPADGSRIETGENKTIDLRVSAKGIKKVSWFVRNDETGDEMALGESQVDAQGHASKAWPVPPANGMGTRIVFARDAASDFESAPVRVELYTVGEVKIIDPPDYFRVPFGTNVTFRAEMSGAATDVHWFVDGEELKSRGESVSFDVGRAKAPERLFRVQARASMPGGGVLVTPERTVVAFCPAIQASIVQPQVNSIGKEIEYTVSLDAHEGEVSDVVWDMDDGTVHTNRGNSVTHRYSNYGTYTIKASGRCAKCGDAFSIAAPASVVVKKQSAMAKFTVEPSKSAYLVKGWVKLKDQSTGDISKRTWRVLRSNGEEIFKYECVEKEDVNYQIGKDELRPDDLTFILEVEDVDGNAVQPCIVSIRVRFGWIAAGLFLVLGLMVIFAFGWVICGNGPKKWVVRSLLGPAETRVPPRNEHDPECDYESYPNMIIVGEYWNRLTKKAKIPSEVMLGMSSDIEVVAASGEESCDEQIATTVDDAKPFTVERSGGAPYVSPGGTFVEHTSTRNDANRFLFRDTSAYADAERRYLRVHVDVTGEQPAVGAVVFTAIIAVFVLVGVFIASMKFAI